MEELVYAHMSPDVSVTGLAEGNNRAGFVIVCITEHTYKFGVSLPCDKSEIHCVSAEIHEDGKVMIEGMITGSEVLKNPLLVCKMNIKRFSPPGPFTITFNLPNPVDGRSASTWLSDDGMMGCIVHKKPVVSAS